MNSDRMSQLKESLENERRAVAQELQSVGRKNPDVPGEWEAQVKDTDTASTEPDERADKFEEYEENSSILTTLQLRLHNIDRALKKIETGAYGICEICRESIEEARLEVNPAARTCEKHMGEEKNLPL